MGNGFKTLHIVWYIFLFTTVVVMTQELTVKLETNKEINRKETIKFLIISEGVLIYSNDD